MIRDEQQRILQYLDDRLQHMLAAPELWGSAEAVELQVVQILELRHFVLNPTTKAGEREVLARYTWGLRSDRERNSGLAAVEGDRPMTYFIDGGAHRGESVRLARQIYPDAIVIAVEPLAECWVDIVAAGALLVPAALWGSLGYAPFYRGEYEVSSTLIAEKRTGGISKTGDRVPTVTLGSLLLPLSGRVVLKMDIEGAEYEVLERALCEGTLDRVGVTDLYVDFHGDRIEGFPPARHNALVEALLSRGYALPKWDPLAGTVMPWGRRWLTGT